MNSISGRVLSIPAASVTNSGASSSRALHVELTSQQRRLRHLRSIAARNIVHRNGSPLLDTYFTLHLCAEERISRDFYKSEVIRDSLNPTWRSLDFGMLPDLLDTSVSCFVVRIWGGQAEQYQLLIEWKVNLNGLRYTGQQIRSRYPNEIIFGLNDGYYAADFEYKDSSERKKKNSLLQVEQTSVRNSYSVFSLLRLHTAQRAIKQTQVTVQKIGREIEEKLRTTASCTERKKERECMQLRIAVLRSELERQTKALSRETDLRQKERAQLQKKEESFSTQHGSLKLEKESLTRLQKECTAKREQFLKSNAQLTFRCRQLLSELSYIYPIDVTNQTDYVICGVKLPNSEDFQAKDDGSVAVALGYTAHLVLMISCFLQIPLRYPVIHKGSRSSIKDTITDRLTEKEREFPLYPRGERFHFEYGVYLLNKNIAQLRYQHGLTTPDLQQTLPNLKTFLEHGLMVRCDRHVSSSISVPKSSLSIGLGTEFPSHSSSPDRSPRKRSSSEADQQKAKPTPPPSYNTAVGIDPTHPQPPALAPPSPSPKHHPSLDASMASLNLGKPTEGKREGEVESKEEAKQQQSEDVPEEEGRGVEKEIKVEKLGTHPPSSSSKPTSSESAAVVEDKACSSTQNSGTMNGSLVVGPTAVGPIPELHCSVEQAEEIMGTEATGLGLGLEEQAQLEEEYRSIPVDHAVAVECDEQVLGELDVAGFEEFSRRIYALNENMSSFRRPRKNSDK
ncbi:UV radiation resistance-associated gene protein isoform X2 [Periophthalmus magnuspinnatus]|uniref:UV radiation resistance-associated gene protein isoform X2 n=1 Tax=Periophthalmus magnuspinnatus TaxID=409849 RepID=UPI00145A8A28|nr:UV radiation resistance-associated gene protein isoform X2 [Periophthalmus magnuspinnatus]